MTQLFNVYQTSPQRTFDVIAPPLVGQSQLFRVYGPGVLSFSPGNSLLTTSYIVDMDHPTVPGGLSMKSQPNGPSTDKRGRPVKWDD